MFGRGAWGWIYLFNFGKWSYFDPELGNMKLRRIFILCTMRFICYIWQFWSLTFVNIKGRNISLLNVKHCRFYQF